MKHIPSPTVLAATAMLTALPTAANSQNNGQLDPQRILDELRKIREMQQEAKISEIESIHNAVRSAASSPTSAIDFYYEAVMKKRFSGLTRENTQLRDWKIENDEKHDDPVFREALQHHLAYIALSLRRTMNPEDPAVIEDLKRFAMSLYNEDEEVVNQKEWMQSPINSPRQKSEIVDAYGLDHMLPPPNTWEMVPGNPDGMFEKSILPAMRERKDPDLITYWNARIENLKAQAGEADQTFERDTINQIKLPEVYWKRAQDLHLLGRQNEAINEMLLILKKFPGHPAFDQWIADLEKKVTELAKASPPNPGQEQPDSQQPTEPSATPPPADA